MKNGELFIDGEDAVKYGLILTDNALSALLAPRVSKDPITSECIGESGKRTVFPHGGPYYASRDISLEFGVSAKSASDYRAKMKALESAMAGRFISVTTPYAPGVRFRLRYVGHTSFAVYGGRAAKIVIKFTEDNPANRNVQLRPPQGDLEPFT